MKSKKIKVLIVIACVILTCLGITMKKIWGAGGGTVHLGTSTEIEEEIEGTTKHIKIANTGESNDCYVRVKIFAGGNSSITQQEPENDWILKDDGYYYYQPILEVGKTSKELIIDINTDNVEANSFNVIVAHECTPVVYDDQGEAYADWNTTDTTY